MSISSCCHARLLYFFPFDGTYDVDLNSLVTSLLDTTRPCECALECEPGISSNMFT